MEDNFSAKINQFSEYFIRPKHEPQQSKQPYYLGPLEIGFLSVHYLQKGLLFTKPPSFNIDSLLENLKRALSLSLVHFYPLAGRLETAKCEGEHACWVYLDCNKGPGARLIHAVSNAANVGDIVAYEDHVVPVVRSFFELGERDIINQYGHTRALLTVQVTELVDGVFIGFTMNHSVVDGTCFWHFVNTLSEIFRSTDNNNKHHLEDIKISHVPIYGLIFPEGYGPIIKLPYSDTNEFVNKFSIKFDFNLKERIFHFTPSSISKLKAQANDECNDTTVSGKISSFQSLTGFLWRSITRARNLKPEEKTTFSIVANSRNRINPTLSEHHFGNMIAPVMGSCTAGELLENGLGWVAEVLHKAVNALDDKVVRDSNKMIVNLLVNPTTEIEGSSFVGGPSSIVIGGSVRFDCYGPEFGLGQAVAIRTGYAAKADGKVTASQGREGGGSVDLEVTLLPKVMDALVKDQEFMNFVS